MRALSSGHSAKGSTLSDVDREHSTHCRTHSTTMRRACIVYPPGQCTRRPWIRPFARPLMMSVVVVVVVLFSSTYYISMQRTRSHAMIRRMSDFPCYHRNARHARTYAHDDFSREREREEECLQLHARVTTHGDGDRVPVAKEKGEMPPTHARSRAR